MPREIDLRDVHAGAPRWTEDRLSDWLRDQDATKLAEIARDARRVGESFGRLLRARHRLGTGHELPPVLRDDPAAAGSTVSGQPDTALLRVVARAVLLHLARLRAEGLPSDAAAALTQHAKALTGNPDILGSVDECRQTYGRELGELLSEAAGPVSMILRTWLGEALSAPDRPPPEGTPIPTRKP